MTTFTIIAGERPVGSCPPTVENRWAERHFDDGLYTFTVYVGWLIEDETRTSDTALAALIEEAIRAKVSQGKASAR